MKMKRSLMLGLSLRNNTRETDKAAVMALDYCKGIFDNVVICVPSWQEAPLATCHPLVRCAIAMLAEVDIKVVWGRKAFVSWPTLCDAGMLGLDFHDAFKWELWRELLNCLHTELEELREKHGNITGTFVNTEPDGWENPMAPLKKTWNNAWRAPLHWSLDRGLREAGRGVARVSPVSGPEFASVFGSLGNERDERQTYYTGPPFIAVPSHLQFEWWNTLVTPDGILARGAHAEKPKGCSTPAEAMWFDDAVFARLREQIPGLRGQTIYAHPEDVPAVLKAVAGR